MPDRCRLAVLIAGLVLLPGAASAHGSAEGMRGFYAGVLHPATTPAHVLVLLALGMLLAPDWPTRFAHAWLAFAVASLAGIAVAAIGGQLGASADLAALVIATGVGSLSAMVPDRVRMIRPITAATVGLIVGFATAPDSGPWRTFTPTAAGAFIGLNLGLFYVVGSLGWFRKRFQQSWARIGLRVLAAWLAAIACLLAALYARSLYGGVA